MLATIDPARNTAGAALWLDRRLVVARDIANPASPSMPPEVRDRAIADAIVSWLWGYEMAPIHVLIERPKVYQNKRNRKNGVDALLSVINHIEVECSIKGAVISQVHPNLWKGNVPKSTHHKRIAHYLTDTEHEVWQVCGPDGRDAIGIGMWYLGRTGVGGVDPRRGVHHAP